ncbi:hypothetical protein ACWEIK_28220 [Streptomyces sp. NPDC004673]
MKDFTEEGQMYGIIAALITATATIVGALISRHGRESAGDRRDGDAP